jgi:hypothetical protein
MCSNAINKQLKKMTEVDSVGLKTQIRLRFILKGKRLKSKAFKESVEKAGFFVGSLAVTIKSDQLRLIKLQLML